MCIRDSNAEYGDTWIVTMARPHVHGDGGLYRGGEWVPIEECADLIGSCGNNCETCPRSRTRNSSCRPDGSWDVVIIGAGCIGAAVARELAKTNGSVLLLEAADDVTQGATKGNSGIVHAGYDDKPGTNRARLCWTGNQMFSQLDSELHFGFQRSGSLVVAKNAEDMKHLEELRERGRTNGVKNLQVVQQAELREMEPNIHADAVGALYSPDAGTVTPYEYAIALAENAADNGVEVRIRREVVSIVNQNNGGFLIEASHWEPDSFVRATRSSSSVMILGAIGTAAAAVASAWMGEQIGGMVLVLVVVACGVLWLSLIHISEPTRLLSISYAVFCLKKKNTAVPRLNNICFLIPYTCNILSIC
eukprot:TRINITY_DN43165_c0_g1_i1.p1 TRINITY_DN43165_c0_g1~~TRINITY_DN43165_c0_g1_i1.p1  ORF type:complete len:362 (-),score=75.71 TRINITY_DN43165_c0_g1_i1:11-1096(-)